MDLAFVDKLARDKNGVEDLLVPQDMFDRTMDARGMKSKDSNETLKAFSKMITKRHRSKNFGWTEEEFAGEFKKFCAGAGIEIYSTMSETKAAFAERTIRSLKKIMSRYMEDHGYKYIHKLPEFVTTSISRLIRSVGIEPKNVENSDFMSVLYGQPLREFKQPRFTIGDKVRISKIDLLFRKGYKPQFTDEVFQINAIASRKPPTYTVMDEQDLIIRGKFYGKELMLVI